ncbi:MAG: Rieske (2Fe-2S) protein [Candidatus Marinimicrobia bacterium]|nr:Rieske (2Fe-2S) protein [Candidatus Neomarinimicrobiota bacterium]
MIENKENSNKDKATTSRRSFLDMALGVTALAWFGSVVYPVFRFLLPPKQPAIDLNSLNVGPLDEFKNNSSKIVRFGRAPVLLVREKSGKMKAFSAKCTHLDCNVQYKDDTEQIWCACHNGLYDLEGRNVSGPPPRPLQRYEVSVVNKNIIISRNEGV